MPNEVVFAVFCPGRVRGACIVPVYGTPRVPEYEARKIRHAVVACPHTAP